MEDIKNNMETTINSKYDYILNSSRVLTIPVIRCDDQVFNTVIKQEFIDKKDNSNNHLVQPQIGNDKVFNTVIKQEFIDEIDHSMDNQLLQNIGTKSQGEEILKTLDTEIKIENNIIRDCVFKGPISNKNHSSELIAHLNLHKISNTKNKLKNCNICNLSFDSNALLTGHMKIHTSKIKTSFLCDICKTSYFIESDLKKHLLLHTGKIPYRCTVCNKPFYDQLNFDIHMRTHTEKKLHKCDICDKTLNSLDSLKCHIRVHTGDKPFKCDYCDKAFARKSNLKIHTQTHTYEKP